ncbi:hypothetical protein EDEG_02269 [Edhazardia aedis USNM 41457]|uniref:Uncharacterized protein n=1 Tax=Edhazardia aedis (strain USNM 41457) TaxID=1003232 RepID=J9DPW9_EDHAE|nr:hypothetical protein EDEG_02269 [Edhazardia aedis USNM 41457]|eukprot:EJW03412.1 hypothetical protein EDEG_02269 [Edhazardia aedis USNM 41457]
MMNFLIHQFFLLYLASDMNDIFQTRLMQYDSDFFLTDSEINLINSKESQLDDYLNTFFNDPDVRNFDVLSEAERCIAEFDLKIFDDPKIQENSVNETNIFIDGDEKLEILNFNRDNKKNETNVYKSKDYAFIDESSDLIYKKNEYNEPKNMYLSNQVCELNTNSNHNTKKNLNPVTNTEIYLNKNEKGVNKSKHMKNIKYTPKNKDRALCSQKTKIFFEKHVNIFNVESKTKSDFLITSCDIADEKNQIENIYMEKTAKISEYTHNFECKKNNKSEKSIGKEKEIREIYEVNKNTISNESARFQFEYFLCDADAEKSNNTIVFDVEKKQKIKIDNSSNSICIYKLEDSFHQSSTPEKSYINEYESFNKKNPEDNHPLTYVYANEQIKNFPQMSSVLTHHYYTNYGFSIAENKNLNQKNITSLCTNSLSNARINPIPTSSISSSLKKKI